jgi:hypothetical protein
MQFVDVSHGRQISRDHWPYDQPIRYLSGGSQVEIPAEHNDLLLKLEIIFFKGIADQS